MPTTTYTGCTACCETACPCEIPSTLYVTLVLGAACQETGTKVVTITSTSATHWESSANPELDIALIELDCIAGQMVLTLTPSDVACNVLQSNLTGDCSPFLMSGELTEADPGSCCTYTDPLDAFKVYVSE